MPTWSPPEPGQAAPIDPMSRVAMPHPDLESGLELPASGWTTSVEDTSSIAVFSFLPSPGMALDSDESKIDAADTLRQFNQTRSVSIRLSMGKGSMHLDRIHSVASRLVGNLSGIALGTSSLNTALGLNASTKLGMKRRGLDPLRVGASDEVLDAVA